MRRLDEIPTGDVDAALELLVERYGAGAPLSSEEWEYLARRVDRTDELIRRWDELAEKHGFED